MRRPSRLVYLQAADPVAAQASSYAGIGDYWFDSGWLWTVRMEGS